MVITSCKNERSEELGSSYEISESADSFESTLEEESGMEVFCGGIFDDREELKFVALGDSIAAGYGLTDPFQYSYPTIVCEFVQKNLPDASVSYYNYAHSGDTTTDLLNLMKYSTPQLDGADIVTVCIGANNILAPFFSCLTELTPLFGAIAGFESQADRVDINKVFDEVNAALRSDEFSAELSEGIKAAKSDLNKIFAEIKKRAPNAMVLTMLVYSPYHGFEITMPYIEQKIVLSELSDKWVSELNAVIESETENSGYIAVDCYQPFVDKTGILNLGISALPPKFSLDPHPNLSGHILIANLHVEKMLN